VELYSSKGNISFITELQNHAYKLTLFRNFSLSKPKLWNWKKVLIPFLLMMIIMWGFFFVMTGVVSKLYCVINKGATVKITTLKAKIQIRDQQNRKWISITKFCITVYIASVSSHSLLSRQMNASSQNLIYMYMTHQWLSSSFDSHDIRLGVLHKTFRGKHQFHLKICSVTIILV
jgi:hypothetical protein